MSIEKVKKEMTYKVDYERFNSNMIELHLNMDNILKDLKEKSNYKETLTLIKNKPGNA